MIEYRHVCKAFDVPVLTGVDLVVHDGERLAVVGPSGTGKSVLLKTTIGLVVPDSGDVLIDGESVVHASRRALRRLRRKVAYVFQHAALFDSMTVFDNVREGIALDILKSMPKSEVLERVAGALSIVNLVPAEVVNKLPAELSGGMRKRVGLARAIVGQPRIILYDEPVTGLDPVNNAAVTRLIVQIGQHVHVTSILVTHDVEGALEISDRIALLNNGRLAFVGTPEQFRSSSDPLVRAFADRRAADAIAERQMRKATT
jgi:phospholipid/cholesterol/gamma-HCH transport system ATP-binding protein